MSTARSTATVSPVSGRTAVRLACADYLRRRWMGGDMESTRLRLLHYDRDEWPISGFMPLTQAAFWIATRGGQKEIEPFDRNVWKAAYDELLASIASNDVEIIGRKKDRGLNEPIPGFKLAGVQICYPGEDTPDTLLFSTYPYILCYGPVARDHWKRSNGFDDRLFCDGRLDPEWTHLQVNAGDVTRKWPFSPPIALTELSDRREKPVGRVGRPPLDWSRAKARTFQLMEYHGDFDTTDPEWNAQARLEEEISKLPEYQAVAESTIRARVREFLEEWRGRKRSP